MSLSYHDCAAIERLNCMQFEGRIAQKESGGFAVIRDALVFQGEFGWHPVCMHFQP
jgi:hypothetical protein